MNKKYIGWVPTVSGNLFFSHFLCCSDTTTHSISKNYIDDKAIRYVILFAKRNARDSKKHKAEDGIFRVILQCSGASNALSLSGKIHLYKQELERNKENKALNALIKTVVSVDKCNDQPECIREKYREIEESLQTQADQQTNDFYCIDFSIDHYGFVEFSSKKQWIKRFWCKRFTLLNIRYINTSIMKFMTIALLPYTMLMMI